MPKTEKELDDELDAADAELDEESEDASDHPKDEVDASDERAPPRVRRRPGRPRKDDKKPFVSRSGSLSEGGDDRARSFASKDLATIWNHVVEQARAQNMPIEALAIGVRRLGLGPMPSGEQDLLPINGALVIGDEQKSPGEALVEHIIYGYHLTGAVKTAKLYRCSFYYRTGTQNRIQAPIAELRLGAPEEVQAEIDAKARLMQQKQIDDAVRGVAKPYNAPRGMGAMAPATQYPQYTPMGPVYQPPPAYPYQPPPPIQGASPQLEEMRREMATMMGAMNERARLEGLIPPPAPIPAGPTAEEQAAKTAQIVAQTLVGLGFTPQLAAKLNSPAITPQAMQQSLVSPMEAWRESMKMMREFRQMDAQIREEFAPEEEPEPKQLPPTIAEPVKIDKTEMKPIPMAGVFFGGKTPMYGERKEDETLIDYGIRVFMHNPEIGMGILKTIGDSAIGQGITRLIAQGMPGAATVLQGVQAARLAAAANANGATPNGAVMPPAAASEAPKPMWSAPKI